MAVRQDIIQKAPERRRKEQRRPEIGINMAAANMSVKNGKPTP
jgi:hypothetical protein